ncbi:MAG TPA: tRNA pseudouridine(38-40) synthase TruA [Patescibacteria group bacterium]|nr:tRNA pseudouridine(38-40) synthase TruA [Patescibacteria group bacterium]
MKNIKLTIAYDGTEFHGWQIQPGRRTIQGLLAEIAANVTGARTVIQGAGRTDAGVHALGQVASFHTGSRLSPAEFQRAFNALLPSAIRVLDAEEVEPRFHARWDALAKIYQYRIFRGRVVPPFHRFYALHYPLPLDEAAMAEAARQFEGVHDFTCFAASAGRQKDRGEANPVREIFRSEIFRCSSPPFGPAAARYDLAARPGSDGCGEELVYLVRGRSFLRHMVRKLVGTLLDVGRGRLSPGEVGELFDVRDRARSRATAPPHGLCLISVEYAEPWRIGDA